MSLQEWVEIRSRELQTKDKGKRTEKGQAAGTGSDLESREAAEPRREQQEATSGAAGEGDAEVEEVAEVEIPLVRKRRRLMRAGEMVPAREGVVPTGDGPDRGRGGGCEGRLIGPRWIPVRGWRRRGAGDVAIGVSTL